MDDFIKLTAELGSRRIGFTIPTDPHITQGEVVQTLRTALDKLRQQADCGSYGGRFLDTPSQYIEPVNMTNTKKENKSQMNNTPLIDSAIRLVELAKHLARIDKQIKNGFEKGITFGGTYEGGVAFPSEFTGLDETFALEIAKEIRDGIRKQICQELANYSKLLGSK